MPLKRARWVRAHVRPVDVLLVAALACLTAQVWWTWIFPPPPAPFAYGSAPFPVIPTVLRPGDTPEVEVTRCNYTDAELTYSIARIVQRQPSGEQWFLPIIGGTAAPGCATLHSRAHTLPRDLPEGSYRLYFVATVQTDHGPVTAAGRSVDFRVAGSR